MNEYQYATKSDCVDLLRFIETQIILQINKASTVEAGSAEYIDTINTMESILTAIETVMNQTEMY